MRATPEADDHSRRLRTAAGWAVAGLVLCAVAVVGGGMLGWWLGWTWWPGVLLVAGGGATVVAVLLEQRVSPRWPRLLLAVTAAVLVTFAGFKGVHPEPLRTPGWEAPGRVVAGNVEVLVVSSGESVAGHDPESGARRWRAPAPGAVQGLLDGVLVFSERGRWSALDAGNGATLWSRTLPPVDRIDVAGAVAAHDGVLAVNTGDDRGGLGLDLRTGETRWRTPARGYLAVARPWSGSPTARVPLVVHVEAETDAGPVGTVRDTATGEVLGRPGLAEHLLVTATHVVTETPDGWRGTALTAGRDWEVTTLRRLADRVPADSAPVVATVETDTDDELRGLVLLDLGTGDETEAAPPGGWTMTGTGTLDSGWVPVRRDDDVGMWQVGADVVELPGDRQPAAVVAVDDAFAAVTRARDRIGREHTRVDLGDDTGLTSLRFDSVAEVDRVGRTWVLRADGETRVLPDGG